MKDVYSNVLQEPRVANDQIMIIGEFGLGGLAVDLPSDDCNSVAASGIYKTKATTANCPDDITDTTDSVVFAMPIDNQIQQQMFFDKSGGVYSRTEDAGTWSEWLAFNFAGQDIKYGDVDVTNRATIRHPDDALIVGYVEQVDSADDNILRFSATDQNLDTTIELYGDASSTQVKVIVIKAGGTEVKIDSGGIKSNKMGNSPTHLVQKGYVDSIDILPFIDDYYAAGGYNLPSGFEWTDFREVHLYVYPFTLTSICGDVGIAPQNFINQYPTNFRIRCTEYEDEYVELKAETATSFSILTDGANRCQKVIGFLKASALHKLN